MRRKAGEAAAIAGRGALMGAADIVPGVSGGTVAFITGIYDRLIAALSAIGAREIGHGLGLAASFWHPRFRRRFAGPLRALDWGLLLPLGLGIVVAALSLAPLIGWLLRTRPVDCYAVFTGLIAASALFPWRNMAHRLVEYGLLVAGAAAMIALALSGLELAGSTHPAHILLSGAVAVCALILPGVSGSYLLLMLGQYEIVIAAVEGSLALPGLVLAALSTGSPAALAGPALADAGLLAIFLVGMALGLLSFVRLLRWLLARHHSPTMAALTGLMLGSLVALYPLAPERLAAQGTEAAAAWLPALLLALAAAGLVVGLDRLRRRGPARAARPERPERPERPA